MCLDVLRTSSNDGRSWGVDIEGTSSGMGPAGVTLSTGTLYSFSGASFEGACSTWAIAVRTSAMVKGF
jgi:hypothetical protein